MEVTFIYPHYLWFLIAAPLIIITHFYGLKYSKRVALKFSNFEAISRVSGAQGFSVNIYLLLMRLFTLIFTVLALTAPTLWYVGQSTDFDFILAIDSSGSMLAEDFSPNRLDVAKNAALSFVDAVPKDTSIGVISFTGTTFIKQMPIKNLDVVRKAISNIWIEKVGGTAIGEAIVTSTNVMIANPEEDRAKVLVLLTDGQNNVGVIPDEAIKYANDYRLTIYTIGVGTEEGGKLSRTSAITKLDEELLKKIAENTGGKYYRAKNKLELESAYKEIAVSSVKKVPIRLTFYLIFGAVLLTLLEWILVSTKFRTVP